MAGGLLAILLTAGGAHAQDQQQQRTRIAILPFSGFFSSTPRGQLIRDLCPIYGCISTNFILRGGRPDWDKVRERGAIVAIMGKVVGTSGSRDVELEAYRVADERRIWTETHRLTSSNKLDNIQDVTQRIEGIIKQLAGSLPSTAPVQQAVAPLAAPPVAGATPAMAQAAPAQAVQAVEDPLAGEQMMDGEGEGFADALSPVIAFEVGVDLLERRLDYTQLEVDSLRGYRTDPVVAVPRVRMELYPFALARGTAVSALGIEADYLSDVGLKSIDEADGLSYETNFTRFDVGLGWPFRLGSGGFALTPVAGYRFERFEFGQSTMGTTMSGLANVRYEAARAGAALELTAGPVDLGAKVQGLYPFTISGIRSFFPDTSGLGMELEATAGVHIGGGVELRARGHFGRYFLNFETAPEAEYRASGALDTYKGASILARYTWGGARR